MPSDQERLSKSILDVLWSWTDGTPRTPCANLSIRNAPQLKTAAGLPAFVYANVPT